MPATHIQRSIDSIIQINALPEKVWDNITNVDIEQFADPIIFRLLDIPKPVKAEITSEGETRIAYFENGKRFLQKIIIWKPLVEYSFSFNPENGFRVCYFFDLSEGFFRILEGSYYLKTIDQSVILKLTTTYSIDNRFYFLFKFPSLLILKLFQRYLLKSIKRNSE